MAAIQVVIDTNVLIAALRSRRGASFKLLSAWGDPRWEANLSNSLLAEYESVAKRMDGSLGLTLAEIDDLLDHIRAVSRCHSISFLWRPQLPDPSDDHILELAVQCRAEFIVSFNRRDFRTAGDFGICVIAPKEFAALLERLT